MLNRSASIAMSTCVLKALPGKLDIKRHSPSSFIFGNNNDTYHWRVRYLTPRHYQDFQKIGKYVYLLKSIYNIYIACPAKIILH